MINFILQCLFVTFLVRFWSYYRKKVYYIDFEIEMIGIFGDFTAAFFALTIIDILIWLIS